jgi:hypothetical protein
LSLLFEHVDSSFSRMRLQTLALSFRGARVCLVCPEG